MAFLRTYPFLWQDIDLSVGKVTEKFDSRAVELCVNPFPHSIPAGSRSRQVAQVDLFLSNIP